MKHVRLLIGPTVALVAGGVLFGYLTETLLCWRLALSAMLLLSTFILVDGFFRFE